MTVDRMQIERCLRSINRMDCELEQVSFDAVITTDQCGIIASCSLGACDLLGLPPSEACGRPVGEFLSGGSTEAGNAISGPCPPREENPYL